MHASVRNRGNGEIHLQGVPNRQSLSRATGNLQVPDQNCHLGSLQKQAKQIMMDTGSSVWLLPVNKSVPPLDGSESA